MAQVPESAQQDANFAALVVERLRNGDADAWADLCRRYGPGLLYVLKRRTDGDEALAQDLCQETLVEARDKITSGALREPDKLPAFLHSTAKFKVIAAQRKERRRGTVTDQEAIDAAETDIPGPFDNVSRRQTATLVRKLLGEMRVDRDREMLIRFYLRDEDKEDICKDLNIDGKVFDNALYRARGRFREILLTAERKNRLRVVE